MLDTLNRYVQGSPGSSRTGLQDWMPGAGLDPRWPVIVGLSILGHILFYTSMVALDWWVYQAVIRHRPVETEQLVKVAVLAVPAGERKPLRAPPERIELVDPRHMKFETGADDTQLSPRSPNPGATASPGPRQAGKEQGSGADSRPAGRPDAARVANDQPRPQPPGSKSIPAPELSTLEKPSPATLPVSPADQPPLPATPGERQQRAGHESGQSGDDSGRSGRLGLRAAQSQYVAYVRRKIYAENQRIMPRGWIETILAGEVVSEFSLVLERSGRVRAVRLVQSCGYATLDKKAREAISLASPFEGFPPELGETFEMTVDVHYTPYH